MKFIDFLNGKYAKIEKIAVSLTLAFGFIVLVTGFYTEHQKAVKNAWLYEQQLKVNDSTKAQLAKEKEGKKELPALDNAAKTMGGKLVAGVTITTKPETVTVTIHDAPTTFTADSTRLAALDSTFKGYHIHVEGKAPPYPAALQLGYRLDIPSFSPSVGFVKRDEGYYAVVSWAGQDFETKNAFYSPPKTRALSLVVGGNALAAPSFPIATVHGDIYGALQYDRSGNALQIKAGFDGAPFVGIGVQRRVW